MGVELYITLMDNLPLLDQCVAYLTRFEIEELKLYRPTLNKLVSRRGGAHLDTISSSMTIVGKHSDLHYY